MRSSVVFPEFGCKSWIVDDRVDDYLLLLSDSLLTDFDSSIISIRVTLVNWARLEFYSLFSSVAVVVFRARLC